MCTARSGIPDHCSCAVMAHDLAHADNNHMYTLYGIKTCDTVKKARKWLDQQQLAYRFHDYRNDGLDSQLLRHFASRLDWEKMLNRRSTSWRQLSATDKSGMDEEKALQLMMQHPTLIKRPILDTGDKLILGFSSDAYQILL